MQNAPAAKPQSSVRLRGRSFMAFVLAPSAPLVSWLTELDKWRNSSAGFFAGKAIILDLGHISIGSAEIARLIDALRERGIRVMGIENIEPERLDPSLPPLIEGGRPSSIGEPVERRAEATSLLIETHIRSGQSVVFPYGDITILGSVGSGAEVVAGGSVHIYGALRGRALAGSTGDRRARVFCLKNEAELISIDGYYRTADDMDASLRGRAVQCWLRERVLAIAGLDLQLGR